MTTRAILNAQKRAGTRKAATRKLRATGRVPAVLYGKDQEPLTLSVDGHEATNLFQQISVENTIIDLKVEGDRENIRTLVREVQVASIRPDLVHIDFYRIREGVSVEVDIPIELAGVPGGVRNDGGILEQIVHELPVRCLPDNIPESIQVDVTPLQVHDSLHVGDLSVPEGVEVLIDPERTLCLVSAPRVEAEPTEVEEAPETEVIGAEAAEEAPAEEGD